MLKIIAHRGFWKTNNQQNQLASFENALINGYGIETDVRDLDNQLVVSHNPPGSDALKLHLLLTRLHRNITLRSPLAINIKSCGLAASLNKLLNRHKINDYFVFDMAIPDTIEYLQLGLNVFLRLSEYEPLPDLDGYQGIWIDQFHSQWFDQVLINTLLETEKSICFVSPELHNHPQRRLWDLIKEYKTNDKVLVCTDYPDQLKAHLND